MTGAGAGARTTGGEGAGTTGGGGVGTVGAGDRGWGLLATLVGMRVTVALGSRLRGNDGRGAGMTGAGAGASADPAGQPALDYRYLVDPFDRERMRGAVRLCAEISTMPEYAPAQMSRLSPPDDVLASDDALDAWLLANVVTQHHSSGTCKMGPASDPMAVVDQGGRVHGLSGLMVVDASIMPDVVRSNTNATTIMIAEKIGAELSSA